MDRSYPGPKKKATYASSVIRLLAHLGGTAVIFVTLLTLTWAVGYFAAYLDGIHQFDRDLEPMIHKCEVGAFWLDVGLSAALLLAGAVRFMIDLKESL